MTIGDEIRDEKLQCDNNRKAAKISALSSGKIEKYEYLAGVGVLSPNQRRALDQAKFTYSHPGKAFEKQIKTIEDHIENQTKALEEHGEQLVMSTTCIPIDK